MAALLAGTPARGEVHKCKDANGKPYFSDRGCVGGGEKMRSAAGGASHVIGTKEADDEVAQRCLEMFRQQTGLGSAESTRVESYRVKWVSVREVGARRLFNITVGFLGPGGFPTGHTERHDCLLRGDNVTFQNTPYELVK